MNKFLNFFTAILFVSTAILISCGGSDPVIEEIDPLVVQGELLAAGGTTASSVRVDGLPANGTAEGWDDFTLNFTFNGTDGGSFTTQGSESDLVWASSGTWNFKGTNTAIIERTSNGETKDIAINLSETDLTLTFVVVDNGRILTFGGEWIFGMTY